MEMIIKSNEGTAVTNSSESGIALQSVVITSSPHSSCHQPLEFEVFLSFRGPDVRKSFADCLYRCLVRSKIRTFRDEEELHKGEKIGHSLIQAISESKVYIPVLTKSYASSKWCLQELAKMLECLRQGKGHIILPIFYFLDPRDVRHQAGPYKEAFEHHVQKHDPETVQEWREALREVGQMKGWHVTESDGQGAVIDEVFSKVELHLRSNYTLVTDELVGIDFHVQEVTELLNLDLEGGKIVGIHGMSGIGKTTIAKAVYDKICTKFNRCCFLENVCETLSKNDGITALQNKVISSILRDDSLVKDACEGINIIRDRVCKYKVLIILDDVGGRFEFDQILGKLHHFSEKSRFLITTRDKRVLEFLCEYKLYIPREMSLDHSLQLFSRHAFGMHYPPEDYTNLSEDFVKVAARLPLALKVIGSLLFRRDKQFWEEKLMELKEVPTTSNELQQRLKISYNELTYNEKQIFLDIACFFIGKDKEMPFHMWSGCGFYPESGIRTLVFRSFVKIDERNQFWMHDLLRDLGRAIVIEEDVKHPYKRSRIWSNDDAINMLNNGEGTDHVEMLIVDARCGDRLKLTDKELKRLSGLRYLSVKGGALYGDFSGLLPNIRWLSLYHCTSVPIDFNMKRVFVLELQNCSVGDDWMGWNRIQFAGELKVINLRGCDNLYRVPDLSKCGSLEWIDFNHCDYMAGELYIGSFKNLKVLRLKYTRITELTGDMRKLRKLHELKAGNSVWKKLPVLPISLKRLSVCFSRVVNLLELQDLEELCFKKCDELDITGEIWQLSKLKTLKLYECLSGRLLADQEGSLPSSLIRFVVSCSKSVYLERLPNLGNLNRLTELRLSKIDVVEIHGLGALIALEVLEISKASELSNLDGLENLLLLKELVLVKCYALECLPSLTNLTKLHKLEIWRCNVLSTIQGLGELGRSLSHLEVSYCPRLANLDGLQSLEALESLFLSSTEPEEDPLQVDFPDLSRLQNLKYFHLRRWRQLTEVTGLERLRSLQSLCITDCKSLRRLPELSGLKNLEKLDISGCTHLIEVIGLEGLESLQTLNMSNCQSIERLPDLSALKNLETINMSDCSNLIKVKGFGRLGYLRELNISNCRSIDKLPTLSGLKMLKTLYISDCIRLVEIAGFGRLESLQTLVMSSCRSIQELPDLSGLKNLETLGVKECTQLIKVIGLESLVSLRSIDMYGCKSIKELPDLSGLKQLWALDVRGCKQLTKVKGLEQLEGLGLLQMDKRLTAKHLLKSAAWYGKKLTGSVRGV